MLPLSHFATFQFLLTTQPSDEPSHLFPDWGLDFGSPNPESSLDLSFPSRCFTLLMVFFCSIL